MLDCLQYTYINAIKLPKMTSVATIAIKIFLPLAITFLPVVPLIGCVESGGTVELLSVMFKT